MTDFTRKPVFDTVRAFLGRGFTAGEVRQLDAAIDAGLGIAPQLVPAMRTSPAGIAVMHKWEGCEKRCTDGRFEAYPDPGSADGKPWTIGWGSTGPDIKPGTVWSQAQCDARFAADLQAYERAVLAAIGDAPTTQNQFDALVSFHYNTGAIATSQLGKLHKAGKYADAAAEFGKWIYNNHKPMDGLRNRRADEAALYRGAA